MANADFQPFTALVERRSSEKHPTDELALDAARARIASDQGAPGSCEHRRGRLTKPRIGIRLGQRRPAFPLASRSGGAGVSQHHQHAPDVGAVASPKSDVKLQHMSGPVMIVRIYYMLFEGENGWKLALWFSVILNVNLAILNMLPIPVLDGGHIVLALIEACAASP